MGCGGRRYAIHWPGVEPPARGREPGRHRSPTLLTPNTTNPTPHPTAGQAGVGREDRRRCVQKQKGKTATMVSCAEEMWTDGVQWDWWGSPSSNECVPTHQSWQEGAGADAQEARQEEVSVGDVDRKEQVMTNRGLERESGGRYVGGGGWGVE